LCDFNINVYISGKTHDVIGEAILNELISSRPKTPPPPQPTTTPSVTNTFCTYLMETVKDLPNNLKIQLEEDILALVFAAKKSTVQKISTSFSFSICLLIFFYNCLCWFSKAPA